MMVLNYDEQRELIIERLIGVVSRRISEVHYTFNSDAMNLFVDILKKGASSMVDQENIDEYFIQEAKESTLILINYIIELKRNNLTRGNDESRSITLTEVTTMIDWLRGVCPLFPFC